MRAMPLRGIGEKTRKETGKHGWPLISGKRGPDKRSDLTRKRRRIRTCKVPTCTFIARRGWRKGFCIRHAKAHGFQDPKPKRSHHAKKLKVKDVMMKPKLKLKAKPKLKLKKAEAARVAARAAMESDSEPDVFPFPPRAEDAELFCRMHDEELAKWQSDPDADIFQYPLRAQDKQMLSKLIFLDSKTKAKAKKEEKPRSQVRRSTFEKESQAALSPFPRNASNPYYWEKSKKNKAVREFLKVKAARVAKAGEKKGGKKQNGGRKFERFTPSFEKEVPVTTFSPRRWPKQRVAVESDSEFEFGKNFELKLLKTLAAFDDELVESDAEFHSWSDELQRRSSEEAAVRRQDLSS